MARQRGNNNGGRRSKGERRLVGTRVVTDIADRVDDVVEQRGITVSDYLAALVYSDLGIPLPPAAEPGSQTQLPLSA
jgi:hypothetical protein